MDARVLIVDDERDMCDLLEVDLRARGFEPRAYTSAEEALHELSGGDVDVVLTDLRLRGMDGIEFCSRVVANRPDIPVVVMTAFGSLEAAVAAIRAGAYDFVNKPIDMEVLAIALERAATHRRLQGQVKTLSQAVERTKRFEQLIGASASMQHLFDQMTRIADSETSVLITGESGTGKELVARALHAGSRRRGGPFVAVNCAALPETLLESELFGHARGAFTDARAEHKGVFVQANGGTLLLDEIGELPLKLQPKLLRVLEERSLRPLGSSKEISVDVRLLAATNRDLETAVEERRFREDLYYRIHVIRLEIPPLRARGTDILLLAQHFVELFAERLNKGVVGISAPVGEKLLAYSWRGNVRELKNAIERAVALTRHERITVDDLPENIQSYTSSRLLIGGDNPEDLLPMEEVERRYVLHVLEAVGGNKTLAARILGFDRKTLYRKLERYGEADTHAD